MYPEQQGRYFVSSSPMMLLMVCCCCFASPVYAASALGARNRTANANNITVVSASFTALRHDLSGTLTASPSVTSSVDFCDVSKCVLAASSDDASSAGTTGSTGVSVPSGSYLNLVGDGHGGAAPVPAQLVQQWIGSTTQNASIRFALHCGPDLTVDFVGNELRVVSAYVWLLRQSDIIGGVPGTSSSRSASTDLVNGSVAVSLESREALSKGVSNNGGVTFWLSSSPPKFLQLHLRLLCSPGGSGAVATSVPEGSSGIGPADVVLHVPITLIPVPLSRTVAAVVTTAEWSSGFGGVTTAVSVGRIAAWRRLMQSCGSPGNGPSSGGLLGLNVNPSSEDAYDGYARGAIVGNTVLLMAVACMVWLVGLVWALLMREDVEDDPPPAGHPTITAVHWWLRAAYVQAPLRVCLPGSLLSLWSLVQSTTMEGVLWLLSSSRDGASSSRGGDVLLSVIGLAVWGVGSFPVWYLGIRGPAAVFSLHLTAIRLPNPIEDKGPPDHQRTAIFVCGRRLKEFWRKLTVKRFRWQPQPPRSTIVEHGQQPRHATRSAFALLDDYRYLWYAALETTTLSLDAVLGGLVYHLETRDACLGLAWLSVAACALQLTVCCVAQPFLSLYSRVSGVVQLLLALVSRIVSLVLVIRQNDVSDDAATSLVTSLIVAGGVVDLMASTLSMLRVVLFDVPALLRFLRRYVVEVVHRLRVIVRRQRAAAGGSTTAADDDGLMLPLPLPLLFKDHDEDDADLFASAPVVSTDDAVMTTLLDNDSENAAVREEAVETQHSATSTSSSDRTSSSSSDPSSTEAESVAAMRRLTTRRGLVFRPDDEHDGGGMVDDDDVLDNVFFRPPDDL